MNTNIETLKGVRIALAHLENGDPVETVDTLELLIQNYPHGDIRKTMERGRDQADNGSCEIGEDYLREAIAMLEKEVSQPIDGHTPGPWNVSKHGTPDAFPQYGIYADGARNDLAIVKGDSQENAYANARLIAASPDLLLALQTLVNLHDGLTQGGDGITSHDWFTARTVIAQATQPLESVRS